MDSPFYHTSARGQSAMSSLSPASTNAYQVNLNRTKTKKWVEAKVQSYDGDDWGADEYDEDDEDDEDDEPESMPSPAMRKPATHASGSRYPSLPSLQTKKPIGGSPALVNRAQTFPYLATKATLISAAPGDHPQPAQESAVAGHDGAEAIARPYDALGHAEEDATQKGTQHSDLSASKPAPGTGHLKSDSIGKDENFHATSILHSTEHDDGDVGDRRRLPSYTGGANAAVKTSDTPAKDNVSDSDTDSILPTIAPLRTPSPRAPLRLIPESSLCQAEAAPIGNDEAMEQAKPDFEIRFEPGYAQRQATSDTAASSPVKDNEMLSDEILRSLSPSAMSAETFNGQPTSRGLQSTDHVGTSDSNHSPEASAHIPPNTEVPDRQDTSVSLASSSPTEKPADWLVSPQSSTPRPRFSWEAEERAAQVQAQRESLLPTTSSAASAGQGVVDDDQSPAAVDAQYTNEAASSAHELPHETGRSSLADERAPSHSEFNPVSTPLSESHATLVEHSSAGPVLTGPSMTPAAQTMSFREIMNLSSSRERIAKYNEAREISSSTDSGLEKWLVHLSAEHPDMSSNGPLFSIQGSQQFGTGSDSATQAGRSSPTSHQPQYSNANSPNTAPSSTSRSRLGGLSIPNAASGSTFGHSGNQIGTKSKELMHSAGKMGKGLLSKGRSKLRGTGDKGEAASPSDEPNSTKTNRRMSWGLMSLGVKPRGAGDAPPHASGRSSGSARPSSDATQRAPPSAQSTTAPQIPQLPLAAPLAPFDPAAQSESESTPPQWMCSAADAGSAQSSTAWGDASPPAQPQPRHPSRATAGLARLRIPSSGSLLRARPQSAPLLTMPQPAGDGAVVPPDGHEPGQAAGPAPVMESTVDMTPSAGLMPEDGGLGLFFRRTLQAEDSKRSSSFIGLPPIRRGSAFGLGSNKTKARRAVDRFPIDDDDEDEEEEREVSANLAQVVDMAPDYEATLRDPPPFSYSPQESTILALTGAHGRAAMSPPASTEHGNDAGIVSHPEIATDSRQGDVERRLSRVGPPPLKIQTTTQNIGQEAEAQAQAQAQTQTSRTQMQAAPQYMMHPSQRLPASGPWRLEESKLTVPLHPVGRNRAGNNGSPPQFMDAFDKETGMISPDISTPSPVEQTAFESQIPPPVQEQAAYQPLQRPAQRQRSDVPPSSAQRWPELFACPSDQQGPPSDSGNGPQPYHAPYSSLLTQNGPASFAGVGSAEEEHGRSTRNFGLFKGLGQRIASATSRERPASADPRDQRLAGPRFRGDAASEASILTGSDVQDQRRRRTSFFPGRSGRRPADQGPKGHVGTGREEEGRFPELQPTNTPPLRAEKRRSLFGAGLGGKPVLSSGLAMSSTPNLIQDASTTFIEAQETTYRKKRFSGLAKVSHLLHRNNKNQERPVSPENHGEWSLEPPAPRFRRLGRASTTGSFETGSRHHSTGGNSERRVRRTSVSGLLTSMLGKRATSGTEWQEDPTDTWQRSTEQQSNLHLQPDVAVQAMPMGPGSDRHQLPPPFVQDAHEPWPAATPPLHVGGGRSCVRSASPADVAGSRSSSARPAGNSGSVSVGVVARKEVRPLASHVPLDRQLDQRDDDDDDDDDGCQAMAQAGNLQSQPPPQHREPISNQAESRQPPDHGGQDSNDGIDVAGESLRPSTVSPDLSVTSDLARTGHMTGDQATPDASHGDGTAGPLHDQVPEQTPRPPFGTRACVDVVDPAGKTQAQAAQDSHVAADLNYRQHETGPTPAGSHFYDDGVSNPDVQQPHQQYLQQARQNSLLLQGQASSQEGREGTGSRWKGLTKRMSEQMSGSKPEKKEKSGSNKFLGGLMKRNSKQANGQVMAPISTGGETNPTFQQQQPIHQHSASGSSRQQAMAGQVPTQGLSEPQYEQVPIPRAYSAVHGEGMAVPTAFDVGRRHDAWLAAQQRQVSPLISQSSFSRPGSVSLSLGTSARHSHDHALPQPGPNKGYFANVEANHANPHRRAASEVGSASLRRKSVPAPQLEAETETETETGQENLVDQADGVTAPPHRASTFGVDVKKTTQHNNAEDGLQAATPQRNSAKNGAESERKVSRDLDSLAAELEDTFGAHERRARLATQEEKIWCNPDDDAHFRPQMKATSYPGQEWNPYEGAEFVEGTEE
ncbi:hypothetical protein E4U41_006924 [Claviceps citrina]|nr:hypothetical protein E4U41_006924 [Claviceps citrina]